jgi:hypothetical protein
MRCVFLLFGGFPAKFCGGPAPYLSSHHKYSHLVEVLARLEANDFFCGHLGYSRTVSRLMAERDIYLLYAIRDPRDVLLSQLAFALEHSQHFLHKHLTALDNTYERQKLILMGSLSDGTILQKSMAQQYTDMNRWAASNKTLIVKYEDLVGENGNGSYQRQISTVFQIASFLGLPNNEENIRQVCGLLYDANGIGFRNGKAGEWSNYLPNEILDLFNVEMSDAMKLWGYY